MLLLLGECSELDGAHPHKLQASFLDTQPSNVELYCGQRKQQQQQQQQWLYSEAATNGIAVSAFQP